MLATVTILPASFYEGLKELWQGCVYVGSAIVAGSLAFQAARTRPDPTALLSLLTKVFLIALSTAFLKDWLNMLSDIVNGFSAMMHTDPKEVDSKFLSFLSGRAGGSEETSAWDILWGTKSVGSAVTYAFLWLFGWIAWSAQYIIKLIGEVLLSCGWSLSPLFLAFFMMRPMAGTAQRYIIGLVALVCWPFGWVLASVVTNAMLDAAAGASLVHVVDAAAVSAVPGLTVLLIGSWMLISSVLAPWVTTRVLLMGVNPMTAFAQSTGGVMQSALAGGVGAAVTAATGGAAAPAVMAAGLGGAMAAGSESTLRGGQDAQVTQSMASGLRGFYTGALARRRTEATESSALAEHRRAHAAETLAATVTNQSNHTRNQQPHSDDPNKDALSI